MRLPLCLLLTGLCAIACADRIIIAPTATKIRLNTARFEYMAETGGRERALGFLGFGVTREVEVEFMFPRYAPQGTLLSANLSYNYLPPIVDTSPGISVGVQDAFDRTEWGRMYYLAISYRMGLSGEYNSFAPLELTIGGGVGRRNGVFVGVILPFTYQFRLLADHDLRGVNAGLEYSPFSGFAVRGMVSDRATRWSVRYSMRF